MFAKQMLLIDETDHAFKSGGLVMVSFAQNTGVFGILFMNGSAEKGLQIIGEQNRDFARTFAGCRALSLVLD